MAGTDADCQPASRFGKRTLTIFKYAPGKVFAKPIDCGEGTNHCQCVFPFEVVAMQDTRRPIAFITAHLFIVCL
jgi:hypothetical protein